ncbi:MAG: TIGR03790 family protein, partial [Candidatus Marsarchaeota archaeon]|nr:TIGR03790 family protein [Candidatus Marsarchaeota archaeon]
MRPENAAVIVNSNLPMSQAVGNYYCQKRGIPLQNLIAIDVSTSDSISQAEYAVLAQRVCDGLTSQLGVNPSDLVNDQIQALVSCYGVPSRILGASAGLHTSVDSYLALLFNDYATPDILYSLVKPYSGRDQDFATFRASSDNIVNSSGHSYHLRYLVCRLDPYDDILASVPGGGSIPRDVKSMIDHASASMGQTGRFYLDEAWNGDQSWYGHTWYSYGQSQLDTLVHPSLVVRDGSASAIYLNETDVMGYASFGMHDLDILSSTDWARPHFAWKPGAVAIVNESAGGQTVRVPTHAYGYNVLNSSDPANPRTLSLDQPVMRVRLDYVVGTSVKHLQNYRVALLDYTGATLKSAYVGSDGLAEIDLTDPSIPWPATNH